MSTMNYSSSEFHYYTYNSNGKLITEEIDYLYDGIIDQTRVYTYDSNGNCIREEYYNNGEINPYYVITGTYDINNLCQSERVDSDNDGHVDVVYYYVWMSLMSPSSDLDGDGDVDGVDSFNIASSYGVNGCSGCSADLNGDDNVDEADLSIFASSFAELVLTRRVAQFNR